MEPPEDFLALTRDNVTSYQHAKLLWNGLRPETRKNYAVATRSYTAHCPSPRLFPMARHARLPQRLDFDPRLRQHPAPHGSDHAQYDPELSLRDPLCPHRPLPPN